LILIDLGMGCQLKFDLKKISSWNMLAKMWALFHANADYDQCD